MVSWVLEIQSVSAPSFVFVFLSETIRLDKYPFKFVNLVINISIDF